MGSSRTRTVVAALVMLLAAACGGAGSVTVDEPGVRDAVVVPVDRQDGDGETGSEADQASSGVAAVEPADPNAGDGDRAAVAAGSDGGDVAESSAESGEPVGLGFSPTEVRGLVTSTGVPVAVLAAVGERFVVTTPCGNTTVVGGGAPMGPVDVVLDPGHGGPIDTGAVGPNGLVERDLNLRLAEATLELLDARGVAAVLTRTADYHTTLRVRSELADALEASALISIHHNAPQAPPSDGPGTEIFVQSDSLASARLGGTLYQAVVSGLETLEDVAWQAAPDAGVLRVLNTRGTDAYGMIRRPATPTALVELGYVANPSEAALFATDEYLAVAAAALADGIITYLETTQVGSGYVATPRVFDPDAAPGADVCTDPPLEG